MKLSVLLSSGLMSLNNDHFHVKVTSHRVHVRTHITLCIQQHRAGYLFHSSILQNVCLSCVVVVARDTVAKEGDVVFVLTSSLPCGRQAVPVQWPPSGSGGARTGFLDKVMSRGSELGKNGTSAQGEGQ